MIARSVKLREKENVLGNVGQVQVLQVAPELGNRIDTLVGELRALGQRQVAQLGRLRHYATHRLVGEVHTVGKVEDTQLLAHRECAGVRQQRRRAAQLGHRGIPLQVLE